MNAKKLIMIVLVFISLSNFIYMFFNVKMFRTEYERQVTERISEIGDKVKKDIEYALQFGIPIKTLGGMDAFFHEILKNTPELVHIKVVEKGEALFSASGQGKVMEEISIPILEPGSNKTHASILFGIGDELGNRTGRMFFDLITIFIAGLIIAYEIITFFTSRLVVVPFKESISILNTMARYFDTSGSERFQTEHNPLVAGFKKSLSKRVDQINDLCSRLDMMAAEVAESVTRGSEMLVKEIEQQKTALKQIIQKGYPIKRIIDPSQVRPIVFVFFLCANLHSSFLPIFSRDLLEKKTFLTGLVPVEILMGLPISAHMIMVTVFMLFTGSRFFQVVRQDHAVFLGAFCTSAGLFLCGISDTIVHLILGRMVCAIGFSIIIIYCKQFIIDTSSEKDRAFYLAGFTSAFAGGLFCSIIVGSIMADYFSYRFVFIAAAIMNTMIFVFGYMVFSQHTVPRSSTENVEKTGITSFLKYAFFDRNLICILLHGVVTRITLIGFFYYSLPILLKIDFTYSDIGRIMMFYGLPSIFLGGALNKRIKKAGQGKLFVVYSNIILGLLLVLFHYVEFSSDIFLAGAVIFILLFLGISNSITFPSQSSFLMTTKTVEIVGSRTCVAVYHSVERIGSSLGPIVYGFFAAVYGISSSVALGGLLCIAGNLLFLALFKPDNIN